MWQNMRRNLLIFGGNREPSMISTFSPIYDSYTIRPLNFANLSSYNDSKFAYFHAILLVQTQGPTNFLVWITKLHT
jgi:hypothetical protein